MIRSGSRALMCLVLSLFICITGTGCGESGYEVMRGTAVDTAQEIQSVPVVQQTAASLPEATVPAKTGVSLPLPMSTDIKLDYTVPGQLPNILVDQWGFSKNGDKYMKIRSAQEGDSFEIRRLDSDETVFTGTVSKNSRELEGDSLHTCYFSALDAPGSYYVYNDHVGESYIFDIREDSYGELLHDTLRLFYLNRCGITLTETLTGDDAHSACHTLPATLQSDNTVSLDVSGGWHLNALADRDVSLSCTIVRDLLLSYELYPDVFTDDLLIPESSDGIPDILNEVAYEAQWLLKMQDPRTGGVYGSAVTMGVDENSTDQELLSARIEVTPVTLSATIAFANALAMFSYDYQAYDAVFSTKCLRAADRAYQFYTRNSDASDNSLLPAAASLYRATGRLSYENKLMELFGKDGFYTSFTEDDDLLSGSLIYLITRQRQNTTICSALMKALMRSAETIATKSQENPWMVLDNDEPLTFPGRLKLLVFVDRVITNAEYTGIISEHVHFLCGMNPDAVNFVTDDTNRTYLDLKISHPDSPEQSLIEDSQGLLANPLRAAQFLLLLSALKSSG